MNGIRTYRSEDEEINVKSKKILCPNCHTVGYTIVKKECDYSILFAIIFLPLLIFCFFMDHDFGKKEKHYCRYCSHDCTDVEALNDEECCIIF